MPFRRKPHPRWLSPQASLARPKKVGASGLSLVVLMGHPARLRQHCGMELEGVIKAFLQNTLGHCHHRTARRQGKGEARASQRAREQCNRTSQIPIPLPRPDTGDFVE